MPTWLFLIALLVFPVAEALSIVWMAGKTGWWTLAWLTTAFFGGLALIRFERLAFAPRMLFTLQRGQSPLRALFASTRLFVAGGLLMFPGLLTDVMALLLLLFPGTWRRPPSAKIFQAANDDVIEGEFNPNNPLGGLTACASACGRFLASLNPRFAPIGLAIGLSRVHKSAQKSPRNHLAS